MSNSIHDIPGDHEYAVIAPAQSPGTVYGVVIFEAPYACKVQRVEVIPEESITGAATNNFKWELFNKGTDGTGTASLKAQTFSAGSNVGGTVVTSWYNPATKLALAAGTILELVKTENGAGMLMPNTRVNTVVQGN